MQMLQKVICGDISLVVALWAEIFIAYTTLNLISPFFRQFYPVNFANLQVVPSSSSSSILSSFYDLAKLSHCCDGPGCSYYWGIALLITVHRIFFPLPLTLPIALALFFCDKFMSVSFIETLSRCWEIVLVQFP